MSFLNVLGTKKYCLYIAYDLRANVKPGQERFHTALLVLPKKISGSDSTGACGTKHDARNVIRNEEGQVCVRWVYEPARVPPRTSRLVALLCMGEIVGGSKGVDRLNELLAGVRVVQDDPAWRCRDWAFDALTAVIQSGVVELDKSFQSLSVEETWRNGLNFAELHWKTPHEDYLPMCDASGREIKSNIGRVEGERRSVSNCG